MIKKDFETGGFPVNNRNPILCLSEDGKLYPAYDRLTLSRIFKSCKVVKCLGIWPGKINTDLYILDPIEYGHISPPEGLEDIDSASNVKILLEKTGKFKEIKYINSSNLKEINSVSQELADYIVKAGIKHSVLYESRDS